MEFLALFFGLIRDHPEVRFSSSHFEQAHSFGAHRFQKSIYFYPHIDGEKLVVISSRVSENGDEDELASTCAFDKATVKQLMLTWLNS